MSVSRNGEYFNLRNLQINSLVLTCSYPDPNTMKVLQQVRSSAGCKVSLSCNYPDQNVFNLENVTVDNFIVECKHPDRNVFNLRNSMFINRISANKDSSDRQGEDDPSSTEDGSSKEDSRTEEDSSKESDSS